MTRGKFLFWTLAVLIVAPVAYFLFVFNWSYADGEHAGWVQKFSSKGWLCKTWEGEMSMVSLPGSAPEKFYFTVMDDKVAEMLPRRSASACRSTTSRRWGFPRRASAKHATTLGA